MSVKKDETKSDLKAQQQQQQQFHRRMCCRW